MSMGTFLSNSFDKHFKIEKKNHHEHMELKQYEILLNKQYDFDHCYSKNLNFVKLSQCPQYLYKKTPKLIASFQISDPFRNNQTNISALKSVDLLEILLDQYLQKST